MAILSLTGATQSTVEARVREAGGFPLTRNAENGTLIAFGDDRVLFVKLLARGLVAIRPPVTCGTIKQA